MSELEPGNEHGDGAEQAAGLLIALSGLTIVELSGIGIAHADDAEAADSEGWTVDFGTVGDISLTNEEFDYISYGGSATLGIVLCLVGVYKMFKNR